MAWTSVPGPAADLDGAPRWRWSTRGRRPAVERTASPRERAHRPPRRRRRRRGVRRRPGAGCTGPEATITYSIWGDPAELSNQLALVDTFHAAHPRSRSSPRCPTGTPTGTSSRPASPAATPPTCSRWTAALPRLPVARVLLDLQPFIERTVRPHRPRGPGCGPFHHRRWRPVRPAAGPQRRRAVLQQGHVRRGGDPLPGRDLELGQAGRGGQAADPGRDGNGQPEQWGFYTESTDMENYWSELVWQNGGEIISEDRHRPAGRAMRPSAACSSSRTSSRPTR